MDDKATFTEKHAPLVVCPTQVLLKLKSPHFSRSYGILISFSASNAEPVNVKYEIKVTYVKTLVDEQLRIFKLERLSSVYINDTEPDTIADQLAYETGQVFYPLVIKVGLDGSFEGIYNHDEIKGRWPQIKNKVQEYFVGEECEKYLLHTEQMLQDAFTLDICFQNDWFIKTFFSSIYKSYGPDRKIKQSKNFSLVQDAVPHTFEVEETLEQYLNHYGAIEIHHNGDCEIISKDKSSSEGDQYIPSINAKYNADIVLENDTKAIDSIIAQWSWSDGIENTVALSAFNMDAAIVADEETSANMGHNLSFLDKVDHSEQNSISRFFKSIFSKHKIIQ